MKVTFDDMDAAGVCWRAKIWLRRKGYDVDRLAVEGIEIEELEAHGDMLDALARVKQAASDRLEREAANGGR